MVTHNDDAPPKGRIVRWRSSALARSALSDQTKQTLREVGLPAGDAKIVFHPDYVWDELLMRVSGHPAWHRLFYLNDGPTIFLDTCRNDAVWRIPRLSIGAEIREHDLQFVNSSAFSFGEYLTHFSMMRQGLPPYSKGNPKSLDEEQEIEKVCLDRLSAHLKRVDAVAISGDGCYWRDFIEESILAFHP